MIRRLDAHKDQAGAWDVLEQASGDLAFDVGANVGQSTKVLALGFRKVIAFEPCMESYEILDVEAPANVMPICMAVWSSNGEIELEEHENSISTGQLTASDGLHWGKKVGTRVVRAATLDYLAMVYGTPDFVKIDTEGSEVEVVKGGLSALRGVPNVIIECHKAENGPIIMDMLPWFSWRKLEHELRVGSPTRANHYWIVGANESA